MTRLTRNGKLAIIASVALWVILVVWVVPWVIRQGHAGESLAFVNDVFAGRDVHSVGFYMDAWSSVALAATAVLYVLFMLGFLWHRYPAARQQLIRRCVGHESGMDTLTLLWYCSLWGALGGLGEFAFRAVRQLVTQIPYTGFYWELLWMAPAMGGVAALLIAAFFSILARLLSTRIGFGQTTLLFSFFAIYGVVQSEGLPLHRLAAIVLSLGVAVALARGLASRSEAVLQRVRSARGYLAGVAVLLAGFALLGAPSVAERRALASLPEAAPDLPNIVLIILDTVRAASLSLYGYERPTTPRIDEWARSGVVFERAYSTAPWTLPSHATMFTGRYPFETKTRFTRSLDRTFPTLAEILGDHGYATAGFVANLGYTGEMSGLRRGFARYQAHRLTLPRIARSSWLSSQLARLISSWTGTFHDEWKRGEHVTDEFLGWLQKRGDRPFFAFLNYFDAHSPYVVPEPHQEAFGPQATERWGAFSERWWARRDSLLAPERLDPWVNMYDGGIAYIDHQVGRIREALRTLGELENTVVVITADHGELWGEHGLIEHAYSVYHPVLHIPLLFILPSEFPEEIRVGRPVTLRDLPATLLDVVGLDEGSPIPGRSLSPLWRDRPVGFDSSPLLAELVPASFVQPSSPAGRGPLATLIEGPWHYILNGDGVEELYDLETDPRELRNVSIQPRTRLARERFRLVIDSLRSSR